jgi:tRNA(His) 5'-end guanylyltransferase
MATAKFNSMLNNADVFPKDKRDDIKPDFAMFDSRAFNIPREEVVNNFVWRQQDATRNSIQGLGQKYFSQKQLNGKSCNKIQDILMLEKGLNWNDVDTYFKRGGCVTCDGGIDMEIPIFTQDRNYIDKYLNPDEE